MGGCEAGHPEKFQSYEAAAPHCGTLSVDSIPHNVTAVFPATEGWSELPQYLPAGERGRAESRADLGPVLQPGPALPPQPLLEPGSPGGAHLP